MPFLFERTADQLWLFRLWYLAEIFLKMNKESLSLHRKLTVFINKDKSKLSREHEDFGKLVSITITLTTSHFKTFLMRPVVVLTNAIFFDPV